MLSVKLVFMKYHFLSLWYDMTWDWTQVSQAIGIIIIIDFNLYYPSYYFSCFLF